MKMTHLRAVALAGLGSLIVVGSVHAQQQRRTQSATPESIQKRYGVQGAYDGTTLHPANHRSTAVPVTMDDGRSGEFVIPADRRNDPHAAYYRDDQSGDVHPVRIDPRTTRQQFVQNPRAIGYQPEPHHSNQQDWEKDALIVGAGAGGGALIGAAAGGSQGAATGAVAGGVAGLIYDLVKNKR
jgi:hypothetical protein